jgi:glycerate dehydrogenase
VRIVLVDSFAADQGDVEGFWGELRALGELAVYPRTPAADVVERCRGALAVLTNKVVLGADVMAVLPELRYVGVTATGTNIVDLAAARARGVAVTNVPGYGTDAVAEHVFALLLELLRGVAAHSAAVKAGAWASSPDFCFFLQPLSGLAGKTLVVIGSGAIGGAVARIAEAFDMRVLRAAVPGAPARAGQARVQLDEALPAADVVTLHCPLTDATRGLVGARFLAALKPGAILINTSRGPLVDEAALREALASGRLGGAGLDVLATEPPPSDHPLLDAGAPWARRVVVTPHIAWGTIEARRRLAAIVVKNLRAFLDGRAENRVA